MKKIIFFVLFFFTHVCVADEHNRIFSVFLHTKCYEGDQKTSVVITNNTPYELTVNTRGVFSEKTLHPSLFNIFDYEKYIAQQYGLKSEGVPIQKPSLSESDEIKQESVKFGAFEKKVYFYNNVLRHFTLDTTQKYFLAIAGTVLYVSFQEGGQESTVLPMSSHIIPETCF